MLKFNTLYLSLALVLGSLLASAQSTGINNSSPNSKAALDVQAFPIGTQGLLIPRLTTTQRNALSSIAPTGVPTGLICYSTTDNFIWYYDGTQWVSLLNSAAQGPWTRTGTNVQLITASDNVGIGVVPSATKLEIRGVDATASNLALRLTNSAATTLMTVDNVGTVTIPGLVGPGIVTTSSTGLLSVVAGSPVTGTGVANKVAFWNGTGSLSSNPNFHWDNVNGYLGIGPTAPLARLSVAGSTGQAVHIGNIFSTNYAGINLNGTIADGNYNLLSSSADPNLYINRGTGNTINFRENNLDQVTINAAPTAGTAAANMTITSSNTWGTAIQLSNSSAISSYRLVLAGSAHTNLPANSFALSNISNVHGFYMEGGTGNLVLAPTTGQNVGVGGTPSYKLHVFGSMYASGIVYCNGTAQCSDIRYKKKISSLENAMEKIRSIDGVYYYWRTDEFPSMFFDDRKQIGFIAQETEKILPEVVYTDSIGFKRIDYQKFTPLLLEGIKQIDASNSIQQLQIDSLKQENKYLKTQLQQINTSLEKLYFQSSNK